MSGKNSCKTESVISDNDDPMSMQNSSSLPRTVIIRAVVFVKPWYPAPSVERTYMPFSSGLQSFVSIIKEMPGGKECGLFWIGLGTAGVLSFSGKVGVFFETDPVTSTVGLGHEVVLAGFSISESRPPISDSSVRFLILL